MAPSYKLTYFNGRGRAEVIRLLLAYAKVPYEDVRIERSEWSNYKQTMPWGQMPILEVDGVTISQSKAILRFIANRHGLAGKTPMEQAKCDEYLDAMDDLGREISKWYHEPDLKKKAELTTSMEQEVLPRYLGKFEEIIKKNGGDVLVGKKWTFVDIFLGNMVGNMGDYFPGADLGKFPSVVMLGHNMISLPGIEEWIEKRPDTPF